MTRGESIQPQAPQSPSPSGGPLVLGVDTGGTFTDFVLLDGDGIRVHKVLSTPEAPERAILQGLEDLGLTGASLRLAHGSTVATNAVLEAKGARTAYVTNAGFEDVLKLARQNRPALYDLQPVAEASPLDEMTCFGLELRMDAEGNELQAPDPDALAALARALEEQEIEAVAVNLLFSFRDDRHERAVAEALKAHFDQPPFLSLSSRVYPAYQEYERGMATWINAYIGPRVADYLGRLEAATPCARVQVMQSSGGMMDAAHAPDRAVHLLLSGPAGGLNGAAALGERMGHERLLSFDMGGTSTDVALIDGEIGLTGEGQIAGRPVPVPMVDMHTIGAGGGSIARVDAGGLLRVGPESAGADPGPACYGQGGREPTVTDANLVLGRIPEQGFGGASLPLDRAAAEASLAGLAEALGRDVAGAAAGIVEVVEENMAAALRVISIERGHDPREFTLMSFGGAGGLHVCALAERLGLDQAVVPVHAGVLSALGMTVTPPARELTRSIARDLAELDAEEVRAGFDALEDEARAALAAEGVPEEHQIGSRRLAMRYRGQSHALELDWQDDLSGVGEAFHRAHEAAYGHRLALPVEAVDLRLGLRGPTPAVLPGKDDPARGESQERRTDAMGPTDTGTERNRLVAGKPVSGPCRIADPVGTTWIAAGWQAETDALGNLHLRRS